MSLSFGKSKSKTSEQATGQTDPWDVTIPYVTDLLKKASSVNPGAPGPTPGQTAAADQLKANAAAGNPHAGQIDQLTNDLFGSESYAPEVASGYTDLSRRLTPTAEGANLDIGNNAYLNDLLKTVGDDVAWRTNRQFAGAGRDLSGINQQATARGVAQATAPILFDQYNREVGRTDAAGRDLFDASKTAAGTKADLDKASAGLRTAGIDTAKAGLEAKDYGPNQILNLEEQLKKMPYEELSWLAEILFPAAGLGQQTQQEGTSTSKSKSFGAKADLGTALASLFGGG